MASKAREDSEDSEGPVGPFEKHFYNETCNE
jgi:hypothetical protein